MSLGFLKKKRGAGGGGFRGFAVQSGKAVGTAQSLKLEGVQDIIAVASGKGGVGKSTTAGILSLVVSFYLLFMYPSVPGYNEPAELSWVLVLSCSLGSIITY